jgi:hypothetical protein
MWAWPIFIVAVVALPGGGADDVTREDGGYSAIPEGRRPYTFRRRRSTKIAERWITGIMPTLIFHPRAGLVVSSSAFQQRYHRLMHSLSTGSMYLMSAHLAVFGLLFCRAFGHRPAHELLQVVNIQ